VDLGRTLRQFREAGSQAIGRHDNIAACLEVGFDAIKCLVNGGLDARVGKGARVEVGAWCPGGAPFRRDSDSILSPRIALAWPPNPRRSMLSPNT
jgi:hypothetical protein